MHPISDGCRLCLDPSAECFTTIDNPQLKDQMEKVFCFSVKPIQGYCSSVCQSCSYAISEFYQYSEKVRHNQEVLSGNVTNCDTTVDLKITIGSLQVKMLSDSRLSEMTENSCDPKDEISNKENDTTTDPKITLERVKSETLSDSELPETTEPNDEVSEDEDDPSSGVDELYEPPTRTKRKGCPDTNKLEEVEADEPAKRFKQLITDLRQKQEEENQLFNKHFRMICALCGMPAATFTALFRHFRKEHKLKGWILCCNTKLFSRSALLDHIDLHTNPDAFRCEVCGKKYRHQTALNEHKLRKHSSEDKRTFKCDVCPQSFALKHDFTKHMVHHVKVKCLKCKKMFRNKTIYNTHMRNQHGDIDRSIVCTICDKLFVTKKGFDHHMNEHMGVEVRVQCGICQRWLKNKDTLRRHMNTVHADDGLKLQCDICLKKFRHIRTLQRHTGTIHAERKHGCNLCGKKFRDANDVKEHRTIHTGECLHACEYCEKPIQSRQTLRRHIKRHHPTEWAQKRKTVRNSEQS